MGVYRKNVGLLKATYKSNVKVGSVIIESPGKFLANSYGLDAASLINVKLGELPNAITDFIAGNNLVTAMNVPPSVSDVNGIYTYLFPNLEKVYLGNAEGDATLKDDLDRAYANLTVDVYCEDSLVAGYQAKYASATNLTFIGVSNLIAYEIPFVGETTLTAEYVEQVAADLGTLASAMEKIVVPNNFTDYEAGALDEIFTQFTVVTDIESPWLNGNISDGLEWTVPATESTTLTAEYIQSKIEDCIDEYATKFIITPNFVSFDNSWLTAIPSATNSIEILAASLVMTQDNKDNNVNTLFRLVQNQNVEHISFPNLLEIDDQMIPFQWATFLKSSRNVKTITFGSLTEMYGGHVTEGLINLFDTGNSPRAKIKLFLPNTLTYLYTLAAYINNADLKVYLPDNYFTLSSFGFYQSGNYTLSMYAKVDVLLSYMTGNTWNKKQDGFIGYLDYTDTVPTFSGYTDTWYEDEDCTTPIATSAFVAGNRYFVKLTAI